MYHDKILYPSGYKIFLDTEFLNFFVESIKLKILYPVFENFVSSWIQNFNSWILSLSIIKLKLLNKYVLPIFLILNSFLSFSEYSLDLNKLFSNSSFISSYSFSNSFPSTFFYSIRIFTIKLIQIFPFIKAESS